MKLKWYMKRKGRSNEIHFHWVWVLWQKIKLTIGSKKIDLIELPDTNAIECEIQTPQFKGTRVYTMHKQCGTFYRHDNKFYPYVSMFGNYTNGDHEVQFNDIDDFKAAIIRLL